MGVPKFFRFISERYPCINEKIKEYQVPEFDNLYLDMNGIIHVCSHPDDSGPVYISSEEQIFRNIFYYVELMFRIIQPKKVFMMAVDGVAPRAKMNQQRGRRFRSARDAELAEKRLVAQNQPLPEGERFDSNCITPGTEFMARLHEQFKFFISHKITTDKLWRIPKIVFSGHDVPGEGEHKIMDYIRFLRSQPDWDPNTRHCLHGLDADLIVLGLSTHEPHFSILREEVKFGRQNKRPVNPEENNYYLLHLSLFRDYLDLEFQALKNTLDFGYDLEKIIDDWILLGFLVGNDFIPHLPHLHISNNSLDFLYRIYIEILPSLGGYINEQGTLNLQRFETFLAKLGQHDFDVFKENSTDLKYFDSKRSARNGEDGAASNGSPDEEETLDEDLLKMVKDTENLLSTFQTSEDESENEEDMLKREFTEHKRDYYKNKLEFEEMTSDVLRSQAEGYIRAIVWNLHYYYDGCPSWSWYYPHHYSPYLSDLKDFSLMTFNFPDDSPFLPFEQLLAVLPAGSRQILPKPFQDLMTSSDSPILDYYPTEFETDLNGKRHEWEAVVLLPFIKEDALIEAMKPKIAELTEDEVRRNSHGPMYIYEYSEESLGPYDSPDFFPDISDNHAKQKIVWRYEIVVQQENLVKGLLKGVSRAYGFPTLENVPFKAGLKIGKVKVFDNSSREHNMILHVKNMYAPQKDENHGEKDDTIEDTESKQLLAAKELLGKDIHVGWPWLVLARVTSVASATDKYNIETGGLEAVPMGDYEQMKWKSHCSEIKIRHKLRMGVELGDIQVLVFVQIFEGADYSFEDSGKASVRYKYSSGSHPYPLQTVVKDLDMILTPVGGLEHGKAVSEIFAPNTECFLMTKNFYGFMAKVCESPGPMTKKDLKSPRITLSVEQQTEPDFSQLDEDYRRVQYFTAQGVASRVGISSHLVSRITGCIFIQSAHTAQDKKNVGLNLKHNKNNQEVLGYTKKENEKWLYSEKTVDLLNEYVQQFPDLFDHLEDRVDNDIYFLCDIFPGDDGKEKVKAISDWINSKKLTSVEKRTCGSLILDENKIQAIERYVKNFKPEVQTIECKINPSLIHLPKANLSLVVPDPSAEYRLLDRIVSVRASHTIPLGARATIIGIEKRLEDIATLYDCLFDREIYCGLQLFTEDRRCYRLTKQAFINLSHGDRVRRGGEQASSASTGATKSSSGSVQTSWRNYSQMEQEAVNGGARRYDHWRHSQILGPPPPPPPSKAAVQGEPVNHRFETSWRSGGGGGEPVNQGQKKAKLFVNQKYLQDLKNQVKDKQDMNLNLRPNNIGSPNVQRFFSAYQPAPKQLVQPPPNQPTAQPQTANMEFQAILNQLQKKKLPEPASPLAPSSVSPGTGLAQPVPFESSCDPEQTNALKRILRLGNGSNSQTQQEKPWAGGPPPVQPERTCGHVKPCQSVLADLCRQLGAEYPQTAHRPFLHNRNTFMAFMTHPDLPEGFINGPECGSQSEAIQAVTCVAAKKLEQTIKERHLLQVQKLSRQAPLLPTPPQQWCQMPPPSVMQPPQHPSPLVTPKQQPPPNKPRVFQPLFVPSQVQGYHPTSPFHRPMNHHHYRTQVVANAQQPMPAPIPEYQMHEPTTFGEPRRNTVAPIHQQQHQRPLQHGPRPKSRIAAKFSSPIVEK